MTQLASMEESQLIGIALGALAVGAVVLYFASMPKLIPGIPCVPGTSQRMFGNLLDFLAHGRRTGVIISYLHECCTKYNEPIMQIAARPFTRPWVVICDGREAQDILTHRSKDFDRSDMFSNLFRAYLPHAHLTMPTNDEWKYHRSLLSDTMTPAFMDTVSASRAYSSILDLIRLWRIKSELAAERAFDVKEDLHMAVVDIVWATTFGTDVGICQSQIDGLSRLTSIPMDKVPQGGLVTMPWVEPPPAYRAILLLRNSAQIAVQSPMGYYGHWLALRTFPRYRWAMKVRDRLVGDAIEASRRVFGEEEQQQQQHKKTQFRAAVDLVVSKEVASAAKQGRVPFKGSALTTVQNELGLFLSAGSTTSAEMSSWCFKAITRYQDLQNELRQSMRERFPSAVPSAEAIATFNNPLLEAFIYEVLRCHANISCHVRTAQRDTRVLDHVIRKGTEVFMMVRDSPSFVSPPMNVKDAARSATSQVSGEDQLRKWKQSDLHLFRPDRWLVKSAQGELRFDPQAAPMQTFGEGPRACFGRRLALLEIRLILTLVLLNFELLPLDPSLEDFDGLQVLTIQPKNARVRLRPIAAA